MQRDDHATIPKLTEEQIDAIAERAAAVALERVYTQIGKSSYQSSCGWLGRALLRWLLG